MANKKFVRIICIVLAALMVLGVFTMVISSTMVYAVTQSEIDALEAQRDAIRSQQESVQEQIDALESEMASVMERKEALDKQNELNFQEIQLIDEQIRLYDEMIQEKAEELDEAVRLEEEQFELYRTRIRTMEEQGNWSYISFLFKATSLSDLLARLNDVIDIIEHDKNLEDEYIAAREHVEEVKAEYEEVQVQQEAKKEELLEEKKKLEQQIEEATQLIRDLESDLDAYKEVYEQNEAMESEVQALIDEKLAELKKQEEEAERKRQEWLAQQQQQGNSGNSNSSSGNGGYVSSGYTWPCPSCTYITSLFGPRVHPILGTYKNHSGVDIGASYGATVIAAASGTVAIAEYSSSYGNYVVIYHADGTATLYGHMSSLAVSAGQTVSQGQTIGYVGSTGLSNGPHLHFEVRVNGACVDPMAYFSGMSFTYAYDA
ncbi:MAG: murein hydrolase activator EnvC family protein [Oscillospiraceae bacterium]